MLRIRSCFPAAVVIILFLLAASALAGEAASLPAALANDNQTPAGTLRDGVLTIRLEIREALWYPEQEGGPSLPVYVFAEEGRAPEIPGPLFRIPEGTTVHAYVTNRLSVPMFVHGLHARPGAGGPLEVAPGSTREVRFAAGSPGTYFYEARSTGQTTPQLAAISFFVPSPDQPPELAQESQLYGAFVVDPAGAAPQDRVFVIGLWLTGLAKGPFREVLVINGKAWPHTERMTFRVGERVRWRWINASVSDHAMHLHGFFYRVYTEGDADRERVFAEDQRPLVVTRHILAGHTMAVEWEPHTAGRWIFHCHMTAHMSDELNLSLHPLDGSQPAPELAHAHAGETAGMGGLVLGITVLPREEAAAVAASSPAGSAPRKLQLLVESRPATATLPAGVGYKIQEGETAPDGPPPAPGAPLVLTRGEPVEITVHNRLADPTSVHWHGIELESYYDGVPMWGGTSRQVTPAIPPGGSFVARLTPPRAGTFIYHTHWHDVAQLTGGLYGPLLVLEPGQKFDPESERIFIIGRAGPDEFLYPLVLNGSPQPNPMVLNVGKRYRFRFINISTNDSDALVSLRSGAGLVEWRAVGMDGSELDPAQAVVQPAQQTITVGETYDFEFTPQRAEDLSLEVRAPFFKTRLTQTFEVQP